MGRIAAAYADCLVITQDNSRSEDPQSIIKDVKAGIMPDAACEIFVELDRERAIALACAHAQSGAIIALLGKGPDEYQIIGARKFHFSERAILESLGASAQL
jgi:UDP-N-acetylmuramoyl-L-alanyl-D-glutamate--2,6-diaminopimelate ligase